jgi:hypothetical protein
MIRNKEAWLKRFSERLGVDAALIEKAFKDELEQERDVDECLEIPDKIEILYKYSYGGISRFFRELRDNQKLYGSKCTKCGVVYLPPRVNCGECYAPTEWVPCGDKGTVVTFATVHYATSEHFDKTPFICAFIKVDGADTLLMQNVFMKNVKSAHTGMRVKIQFKEDRMGDMGDFCYVPEKDL